MPQKISCENETEVARDTRPQDTNSVKPWPLRRGCGALPTEQMGLGETGATRRWTSGCGWKALGLTRCNDDTSLCRQASRLTPVRGVHLPLICCRQTWTFDVLPFAKVIMLFQGLRNLIQSVACVVPAGEPDS